MAKQVLKKGPAEIVTRVTTGREMVMLELGQRIEHKSSHRHINVSNRASDGCGLLIMGTINGQQIFKDGTVIINRKNLQATIPDDIAGKAVVQVTFRPVLWSECAKEEGLTGHEFVGTYHDILSLTTADFVVIGDPITQEAEIHFPAI